MSTEKRVECEGRMIDLRGERKGFGSGGGGGGGGGVGVLIGQGRVKDEE